MENITNNQENNLKEALFKLYEDSCKACIIAGQASEIGKEDKLRQLSYIQSELNELKEAIETNDLVEQLDAIADLAVTIFGFAQKLERQGALLDKACIKVGENNLTKFPTDRQVAEDTIKFYKETKGKNCTISFNPVFQRYVIRDTNGKYLKCKGFIECDLSDCFAVEV